MDIATAKRDAEAWARGQGGITSETVKALLDALETAAWDARDAKATAARLRHDLDEAEVAVIRNRELAEKAERERDEWKRRANEAAEGKATFAEERDQLAHEVKTLEADNAALLEHIRSSHSCEELRCNVCFVRAGFVQHPTSHPGAELLERIQALEAQVERAAADNAALLQDAQTGLAHWHGRACRAARGPYPINPGECEDSSCRAWYERLTEPHLGAGLLGRLRALEDGLAKVRRFSDSVVHTEDCGADDDDPEAPECECGKAEFARLLAKIDAGT